MSDRDSEMAIDDDIDATKKRKGRSYKRKLWTNKEDQAITNLVGVIGECNWGTIADRMDKEYGIKGRTGKQCRERWHNHLDPNVRKEPVTEREEKFIFESHINFGQKWAEIAKKLDQRTDNCIKNHFYSTLRRFNRRINKFMKFEAFKRLTNYSGFKVSNDYLYKTMNDLKVNYDELKTVDTDQWQKYQKFYAKFLSEKDQSDVLKDFKNMLHQLVKRRNEKCAKVREDHGQLEDGANSRRSSRLSNKKSKNYSEDTENFNLYLLMELINLDAKYFEVPPKATKRTKSKVKFDKVDKMPSSFEKSLVFSHDSFGKQKKTSSISFKKANIETHKIESDSDPDEKDSLDMNIGKVVKQTVSMNKRNMKASQKQDRSISFLQNERGISKQSSIGKALKSNGHNYDKLPSITFNTPCNFHGNSIVDFTHLNNKQPSKIDFGRDLDYPVTRGMSKLYNFENLKFGRDESDPLYKANVFNDGANFGTNDHLFGNTSPLGNAGAFRNNSNVSMFTQFRNQSNPFSSNVPKQTSIETIKPIPAIKPSQITHPGRAISKSSSSPFVKNPKNKGGTDPLTKKGQRVVSHPIPIKAGDAKAKSIVQQNKEKNESIKEAPNREDRYKNLRRRSRVDQEGAFSQFTH